MVFRRQRRAAPIKRDKHEVTWSNLVQDASSQISILLARGVQSADKDTATEVELGSHIYGFYIEFNTSANVVTNPKVLHWGVDVVPPATASFPSYAIYYQSQRAQILKRGMEMLPKDLGTVYKRIIFVSVPRKWQRVQEGQDFNFRYVATSTEAINMCGFCIYKEIY